MQLKCNLRFGGKWKVVIDRLGRYLNNLDVGKPGVSAHDDEVQNNHDDVDVLSDENDDNGSGPDGTHG